MKDFLKENWFKLGILLVLILFGIFYAFLKTKEHNYKLLQETITCNKHYSQSEWQKCIDGYMEFYIGINPKLKFPH